MRTPINRLACLTIITVLALTLAVAFFAGCGGGKTDAYTSAVLGEWSRLESDAGELVEASGEIGDEADLEDFRDMLADAARGAGSFADRLDDLEVPDTLARSHGYLEDFLSAYEEYLETMGDRLDDILAGAEDIKPFYDELKAAEESLQDYRQSQDYNSARLDRGVWDLPAVLGEALLGGYEDEF